MNKKNILISVALLVLVLIIIHFNFHSKIWENSTFLSDGNDEIKKEMKLCFSKTIGDGKRIIAIARDEDESETAGGDIFLKNEKIESNFIFKGYRKNDILDAFGEEDGVTMERIYRITDAGIVEGNVGENNIKTSKIEGKELRRIIDLGKITFDDKTIIPKVSCDSFVN